MQNRIRQSRQYFFLMAALLFLVMLVGALPASEDDSFSNQAAIDIRQSITMDLRSPDGTEQRNVSLQQKLQAGDRVTLHVPIPENLRQPQGVLLFQCMQAYVRVRFEGRTLSAYTEEQMPRSRHFGALQQVVMLPPEAYGREITIEEELLRSDARPLTREIAICPAAQSWKYLLHGEAALFLIYHALLIFCVLAFAAFLFVRHTRFGRRGIALMLFVAVFDLWMLGFHRMLYFWPLTSYEAAVVEYGALYLVPIPLLVFLRLGDGPGRRRRRIYDGLIGWFALLFLAATGLQFAALATYDVLLPVLHVSLLIGATFVLWDLMRGRSREMVWDRMLRYGIEFSFAAAAVLLAWFYFINWMGNGTGNERLTQAISSWGFLVFVGSLLLGYAYRLLYQAMQARDKLAAERLAYIDPLTGLKNYLGLFRMARRLTPGLHYAVLFFDLNGLKETNDHYGHAMGDRFLKIMADCLRQAFPDALACGRVGGDEYIVLLGSRDVGRIKQKVACVKKALRAHKGELGLPDDPSTACGFSVNDPQSPMPFEMHLQEADERMYADKAAYKRARAAEEEARDAGGASAGQKKE